MSELLSVLADSPITTGIIFSIGVAMIVTGAIMMPPPDTRRNEPRDLWLSECKEQLLVCAKQWDDGFTLRQIYQEQVSK